MFNVFFAVGEHARQVGTFANADQARTERDDYLAIAEATGSVAAAWIIGPSGDEVR